MNQFITTIVFLLALSCAKSKDDEGRNSPIPPDEPEKTVDGGPVAFEDFKIDLGSITNLKSILQTSGSQALQKNGYFGQNVRIAIFDNGYTGLHHSAGKRLPADLKVMPAPANSLSDTSHGTKMAEIVYAVASGHAEWTSDSLGPQLILYNTNGFSNLKTAVMDAIVRKVDVILYAQVWEYGDNDGTDGFINEVVSQATNAGILWVNASGNFGESVYRSKLAFDESGVVELPWQKKYLRLHIAAPRTKARIVLSWNDFDRSPDYQTPQNLDFKLFNSSMEQIGSSEREQNGGRDGTHSQFSAHAREILTTTLEAGTYYIAVDAKSRNFDEHAQFTIAVDGFGTRIPDATILDSLMAPAGNPAVLAVGAIDSSKTGVLVKDGALTKPEIFVDSAVSFSDGAAHNGTSAASAIMTGALAVWLSANGKMDFVAVKQAIFDGTIGTNERQFCPGNKQECFSVSTLNLNQ